MQENARGTYESEGKVPEGCRGMPGERTRVEAKCQGNAGECRGLQGNTGECQGNIWEWVQSARGMLGNAGECQGNVWEWVQTARGMQGTTRGM